MAAVLILARIALQNASSGNLSSVIGRDSLFYYRSPTKDLLLSDRHDNELWGTMA